MKRMLAEWELQTAILLTWPHDASIWEERLETVQAVFCDIASQISRHQQVIIACQSPNQQQVIQNRLTTHNVIDHRLCFYYCESNDCWARDYGPIAIQTGRGDIELLNFQFNGWGEKHLATLDNNLNEELHEKILSNYYSMKNIPFTLEGGGIETDGSGTLLTTQSYLLDPKRNKNLTKPLAEKQLAKFLGIKQIHCLEYGHIIGDDTGGHIDTLARFCNPTTLAYSCCDDPQDAHYHALQAMKKELESLQSICKKPYRLAPLPLPDPIYNDNGERLPATYTNFLITNQQVLVPTYQDAKDNIALEQLAQCFPERAVRPIYALPLIHQGGSLHCVTMQLPAQQKKT